MDNKAVRPIILAGIFIISLFVFSFFMNQMNKDTTITMEEASLPIMQFVYEDLTVNELHNRKRRLLHRDGCIFIHLVHKKAKYK